MSAIITNDYRIFNVDSFIRSLEGSPPLNYLYAFIGKSTNWDPLNSAAISTPIDCLDHHNLVWSEMMSLKQIGRSNVSAGIKKIEWGSGKVYDIYRHDYGTTGVTGVSETGITTYPTSLAEARYYVVSPTNNGVYICIDNNDNSQSTYDPGLEGTGVGYANIETSDNYIWKFVCSISPSDYANFATSDFYPVKRVLTAPPGGDPYESQYGAQQNAISQGGAIYKVVIDAPGTSANTGTIVIDGTTNSSCIKGDGTGFECAIVVDNLGGVASISITAAGTGYTYLHLDLTLVGNAFNGAILKPIITPLRGLGANPPLDLNAHYLLASVQLEKDEGDGDFTVLNDYRQVGLVVNPYDYNTTSLQNEITCDAAFTLTTSDSVSNFVPDGIITNNGTIGRVIDVDAVNKKIRVIISRPESNADWTENAGFAAGIITQTNPSSTATVTTVTPPEIEPNSGQIIYFENRSTITRNATQTEVINIAIEY